MQFSTDLIMAECCLLNEADDEKTHVNVFEDEKWKMRKFSYSIGVKTKLVVVWDAKQWTFCSEGFVCH